MSGELVTRKPTGLPSWPIMLIAGAEKAGKSYSSAEASASDLVDRTFWVGVGEDDPDELGALPGARFEIVTHDGTFRGILAALSAAAEVKPGKKPNLLVLDSATRLWDLLCDEQQVEANRRAKAKAEKYKRPLGDEDATITMDQWNTAKQRWAHTIDTLKGHRGPSIVTARLEEVTVLDSAGKPTSDKTWKVKAEKSLPFDVGAIVEMPKRGETFLTGVRSLRFKPSDTGRTEYKAFTVDKLWRDLGLAEQVGERTHSGIDAEDKPKAEADQVRAEIIALCTERSWSAQTIAAEYLSQSEGTPIKDAAAAPLRGFLDELKARKDAA